MSLSTCLERYLDAKRSVLLFSKGILLVEGDGEEILIPAADDFIVEIDECKKHVLMQLPIGLI